MPEPVVLSARERVVLVAAAACGGLLLNGSFLYVLLARADLRAAALGDPVAWVLLGDALLVTGVLAWAFGRWGVDRLGPRWFWVLSLAGGLAFAVPFVLLVSARRAGRPR